MPLTARLWSYSRATTPRPDDDSLIVCCLSLSMLGIDGLAEEIVELHGELEGRRWHRRRAEEFAGRLLDAFNLHLPTTEAIVHIEDSDAADKVRVVVSKAAGSNRADRASELTDRVTAIRRSCWLLWRRGLEQTMASLRELDEHVERQSSPDIEAAGN